MERAIYDWLPPHGCILIAHWEMLYLNPAAFISALDEEKVQGTITKSSVAFVLPSIA